MSEPPSAATEQGPTLHIQSSSREGVIEVFSNQDQDQSIQSLYLSLWKVHTGDLEPGTAVGTIGYCYRPTVGLGDSPNDS